MKKIINIIIMAVVFASSAVACSPRVGVDQNGINALASTSFLADIAQNVAGERFEVRSLLPFDTDPHAYQTVPQDAVKVEQADLLILNGFEYDAFIEPLVENVAGNLLVVEAASGLDPLEEEEHAGETGDAHGHEAGDPHMWLDPVRVIRYVENIRDGITEIDPEGAEVYSTNASAYIAELNELDAWIVEQTSQIPAERRLLATNHESLGYFAERYGFEIVGAIIPGSSTDAAPSAQEMAGLIEAIRSSGAPAIFLGEVENPAFAEQIASETGVEVVSDLYLESLTEGAPAATYIEMMKYNVMVIVKALK